MLNTSDSAIVLEIYDRLYSAFGPQNWWPAQSPFEVIVGAVLTQNTAWTNVEKAIASLQENELLNIEAMMRVSEAKLADLIRSSGYYRLKAQRLKAVLRFVFQYYGGIWIKCPKQRGANYGRHYLQSKGLDLKQWTRFCSTREPFLFLLWMPTPEEYFPVMRSLMNSRAIRKFKTIS